MTTTKRQVKDVVFDILKAVAMKRSITWDKPCVVRKKSIEVSEKHIASITRIEK
jgi:hypothetical protein